MKNLLILSLMLMSSLGGDSQNALELATALNLLSIEDTMVVYKVEGRKNKVIGFFIRDESKSRLVGMARNKNILRYEISRNSDSINVWSSTIFTDKKCLYSSSWKKQLYFVTKGEFTSALSTISELEERGYNFSEGVQYHKNNGDTAMFSFYKGSFGTDMKESEWVLIEGQKRELLFIHIHLTSKSIFIYDDFEDFRKRKANPSGKIEKTPIEMYYYILHEENTCIPLIPDL